MMENKVEWMVARKDGWRGRYCFNSQGVLVAKTCSFCHDILDIKEFNKNSAKKYGVASACRTCMSKYNKQWATTPTDSGNSVGSRRYETRRETNKNRTEEEVAQDQRRLRPKGTKKCTSCRHEKSLEMYYSSSNYEDGLQYKCKECTVASRSKKYEKYWESKNIPLVCYICQEPYAHSDHVVPLSLYGPDSLDNRLPMCGYHNNSKNGSPLLKWLTTHHPDKIYEVLDRVLSYGVSPWTYLDSPEEIYQALDELEQYQSYML